MCGCTKDTTELQGEFRRGRTRRGLGEGKQAVFGKNALSFFKRKKKHEAQPLLDGNGKVTHINEYISDSSTWRSNNYER